MAVVLGIGSFGTPRSEVNRKLYKALKIGKLKAKPNTIAGNTNIKACSSIIMTMPYLLSPTMRITPISNVLVSTLIMSNEYISRMDMTTKSSMIMSKMRPIKSTAYE